MHLESSPKEMFDLVGDISESKNKTYKTSQISQRPAVMQSGLESLRKVWSWFLLFWGHAQSKSCVRLVRWPSKAGIVPDKLVRSGRREFRNEKASLFLEKTMCTQKVKCQIAGRYLGIGQSVFEFGVSQSEVAKIWGTHRCPSTSEPSGHRVHLE